MPCCHAKTVKFGQINIYLKFTFVHPFRKKQTKEKAIFKFFLLVVFVFFFKHVSD